MATAIVSLATGRTVSEKVGMTGEITLTGQALQIGGVREKVLAAQRAGLTKVILPRENEADLSELPEETRKEIEFVLVDNVREVLDAALDGGLSARPRPAQERQAASRA
jgi:ATP-dependent Lon protease